MEIIVLLIAVTGLIAIRAIAAHARARAETEETITARLARYGGKRIV
jgi:hypothetical protein